MYEKTCFIKKNYESFSREKKVLKIVKTVVQILTGKTKQKLNKVQNHMEVGEFT